jgi:hypothetical protein
MKLLGTKSKQASSCESWQASTFGAWQADTVSSEHARFAQLTQKSLRDIGGSSSEPQAKARLTSANKVLVRMR